MRRVRELQTLYFESAPRELAQASRVRSLRAGTLVIGADNAAVAAKLRQLAPRILAKFRKTEGQITKIRIEVQVAGNGGEVVERPAKKPLTPQAADRFAELSRNVADDGLKAALSRLARDCGFGGKVAIHPRQVPVINSSFSPTAAEIERARNLIAKFRQAESVGRGAFQMQGMMVDCANVRWAERVLDLAETIEAVQRAGSP